MMRMNTDIDQVRLKQLVSYNPETGLFTNKRVGKHIKNHGGIMGCTAKRTGYIVIRLDGKLYLAHRLAWLYVYGTMPPEKIDHKDTVRANNWIENLRLAGDHENAWNTGLLSRNKSGYKGVCWSEQRGKWRASIKHRGKYYHLGYFERAEDAYKVRCDEALRLHGEFANLGIFPSHTAGQHQTISN